MKFVWVSQTDVGVYGKERYTRGMLGQMLHIKYDCDWDQYAKTVCFTNGHIQIDDVSQSTDISIPHEMFENVGDTIQIGFYGSRDGVATPTIWATLGRVVEGTDPCGDESTEGSPPVYAQMLQQIGQLPNLNTKCKHDLVCAINEVLESIGGNRPASEIEAIVPSELPEGTENNVQAILDILADSYAKVMAFLDSDDQTLDQLTELIAAIKENKTTIDSLMNDKVNVADIVNDLVTGGANKVLSAEQGKALKKLIDDLDIPNVPEWAMQPTKPEYTANEVGAIATSELQNAINKALDDAKRTGLFDGEDGVTPNLSVGTVDTLEPGSKATATITGSVTNLKLNLGIPKGANGLKGDDGSGIEGFYSSKREYPPETCVKYATQETNWNQGEIVEPQGPEWQKPGSTVLLAIKCNNGDTYISIQEIVNTGRLKPKTYWVSKKGEPGKNGTGGSTPDTGGDGVLIDKEEVLAQGTIASGTTAYTRFDTGLTVKSLKQWKIFTIWIDHTASANTVVQFGTAQYSAGGLDAFFEANPVTNQLGKRPLGIFHRLGKNSNYLQLYAGNAINDYFAGRLGGIAQGQTMRNSSGLHLFSVFINDSVSLHKDPDGKIYIAATDSPTGTIKWIVRGIEKYGD